MARGWRRVKDQRRQRHRLQVVPMPVPHKASVVAVNLESSVVLAPTLGVGRGEGCAVRGAPALAVGVESQQQVVGEAVHNQHALLGVRVVLPPARQGHTARGSRCVFLRSKHKRKPQENLKNHPT